MSYGSAAMARLLLHPFAPSTTPLQAATYLLAVSLFSISFLVFLNGEISFVVTDLLGRRDGGVGDAVGTLGFADEVVALIACPAWGVLSDRLGVRWVAVMGYGVVAAGLVASVQVRNVYPQLLLARVLFAVGATATATMVTAILPSLTDESAALPAATGQNGTKLLPPPARSTSLLSDESQLTVTSERFRADAISPPSAAEQQQPRNDSGSHWSRSAKPSVLAGYVGFFTGCGALVALSCFLPLPARFADREGVTQAQAVRYSFYTVAGVAGCVAVFAAAGLRGLRGEEGKGWRTLLGTRGGGGGSSSSGTTRVPPAVPYRRLLRDAVRLGFTDSHIALGYLGGFVARASTVAISLFIPLYVNTFFIRAGFCRGSPDDPSADLKRECRSAYILASIITGVAQLTALLCAPLFGYLSGRPGGRTTYSWPIIVSAGAGVVGYLIFPSLKSPEFKDVDGRGGGGAVFGVAALIGLSQIGAIVCSLGSLGRGVLLATGAATGTAAADSARRRRPPPRIVINGEARPLLGDGPDGGNDDGCGGNGSDTDDGCADDGSETDAEQAPQEEEAEEAAAAAAAAASRIRLKGSIAGVYSWCGGVAILLLTKLGGSLFDRLSTGAPFYMMAVFNAALLVATVGIDVSRLRGARSRG